MTCIRRDRLRPSAQDDRIFSTVLKRADFLAGLSALLAEIQAALYSEAKARLDAAILRDVADFDGLAAYFGAAAEDDEAGAAFKGWVRAPWSRPTGAALDAVEAKLKTLKLTLRNVPSDQPATFGTCIFTGAPGVEEILISRAY